jgi:hypothetical protein
MRDSTVRCNHLAILAGCLGPRLTSEPGLYDVTVQPVARWVARSTRFTFVRPPSGYLVVQPHRDEAGSARVAPYSDLAEAGT